MTPLAIRMLLHYSWSPQDYQSVEPREHAGSPAVCDALLLFMEEGLLRCRFGDIGWAAYKAPFIDWYEGRPVEKPIFAITDKGRAMVEHLTEVQIPVCKWVKPEAPK